MRVDALVPTPGETVELDGDALRDWLEDRYALEGIPVIIDFNERKQRERS